MNLFLFGYLCFCITISLTKSSDMDTHSDISERYIYNINNCTQCDDQQHSSCICFEYVDNCVICCSNVPCCVCANCATCWQQQLTIMTQIGIAMLFGLGIFGLIAFYCKMCYKPIQTSTRMRRRHVVREEGDLTYCSTIEGQERPPSYNEAVHNTSSTNMYSDSAPPLYASPYNRMFMSEAPPSYPGTPKLQEKILHQNSNEPPSSSSVVQHM
ncbi:PREDICTED: uncharacterized protein LOC108754204 [Trachymyrmex septentrionalis]|uniref:uncharacterized protein LOC108754204 n=1 Tax=Trachymyrmex septentrionalis TaxID=34720 RepID=UPI00084EDD9B|nr:PREDICTED: uncharacterized protein LOC108754204 [Trachymyrmex septentrionalis]